MARPSKPWYRTDRGRWYVTIRGVVHPLGPDRDEAHRRFHRLMAGARPAADPGGAPDPPPPALPFRDLVGRYLDDLRGRVADETWRVSRAYLGAVVRAVGDVPVDRLTRDHLERAVRAVPTWGPTTQNHVYGRLAAAFRWAVAAGLAGACPVDGVRRPPRRHRGAEVLPSAEAVDRLLAAARPHLRAVLVCLFDTGARPGEVVRVTAADLDAAARVWVLAEHKTAARAGRPRVVHLTDRVLEMSVERAALYPSGPLFRTLHGLPWRSARRVSESFRLLRDRLGLPGELVPYGLRHRFVTEALIGGLPDSVVAALVGHAGTRMVNTVYSHVAQNAKVLREALNRIHAK